MPLGGSVARSAFKLLKENEHVCLSVVLDPVRREDWTLKQSVPKKQLTETPSEQEQSGGTDHGSKS